MFQQGRTKPGLIQIWLAALAMAAVPSMALVSIASQPPERASLMLGIGAGVFIVLGLRLTRRVGSRH